VTDIAVTVCADAAVIAALHRATITVAYSGYFPHSEPPTLAELEALWATRLADPTAVALVARCDGSPVGSVMASADREFAEGHIAGLHVLPAVWGMGVGSSLHDAALMLLSEAGHHTAGLWVIAANNRARRMYERRGWVLRQGVEQDPYGVLEVRYQRELRLRKDYGQRT